MELTKVEIILILRDALEPESFVPPHWQPHAPENDSARGDDSAPGGESASTAGPSHSQPTGSPKILGDETEDMTPFEDHLMQQSSLERMAESSRRIDAMETAPPKKKGTVDSHRKHASVTKGSCRAYIKRHIQLMSLLKLS